MNTATARKLATPKVEHTPQKKTRTALSIVAYVPKQRLPRIPLPIFCAGLFGAGLFGLLAINIAISSSQYELAELKAVSHAMTLENQELSESIRNSEAPQNLAIQATALGLVNNRSTAAIDVDTLTVTGIAVAAVEGDPAGTLLPAPDINSHYIMAPPVLATAEEAATSSPASPEEEPELVKEDVETVPEVTLNGGTVPAPVQRTPGT